MKRKTDHGQVPSREEDLALELSADGRQRFSEMTEKSPQPGAAKRRIEREEAGLAKTHAQRLKAAANAGKVARSSGAASAV